MSDDEKNRLTIEVQGLRSELQEVLLAIKGNEDLKLDGMVQHIEVMNQRLQILEVDVKSLKSDKIKLKAWIAGLATGGGFIGVKISEWIGKN